MKNVFGLEDGRTLIDGHILSTRRLSDRTFKKVSSLSEEMTTLTKNALLPKWVNILFIILLVAGLGSLAYILSLVEESSLKEVYERLSWLFFVSGGCVLGLILIAILNVSKRNSFVNSDVYKDMSARLDRATRECLNELNVPNGSSKIDFFGHIYKIKNDKEKNKNSGAKYILAEAYIFLERNNLCLCDIQDVYSIPLNSIKSVTEINRRVTFTGWNKKESIKSEKYKPYNILYNGDTGAYSIKSYYSIVFQYKETQFELLVPSYDFNPLLKLINKSVTVNK